MLPFNVILLVTLSSLKTYGQTCSQQTLGLSLQSCQPCGSPGLDDFCVKKHGTCGSYFILGINGLGTLGGGSGLAPHGYLTTGPLPSSCNTLIKIADAIPNRNLVTGTLRVYNEAGYFNNYGGLSIPKVSFNSFLLPWIRLEAERLQHCLENKVPKHPNGPNFRWNTVWTNPKQLRVDSFHYEDNGNSTWSYQCYCDFCYSCQACGTVGK